MTKREPAVTIGVDVASGQEVELRYRERVLGTAIVGKSGTGKSSILEHLILADLLAGTPGLVIDPHGLLAERIITLAPLEVKSRIILLQANHRDPFGLNLLAVRDPIDDDDDPITWAADSVVATIKKLYGQDDEFIPRLERYLDLAVRTLIPSRGTLLDAPALFEDRPFRESCLARVPSRFEQGSLRRSWASYDKLRAGEQITHTEALVNRLERLLAPPLIRKILGCRETTVPFDAALNGDKMLIVSLPSERLSPERCDFIGSLILFGFADRIFARSVTGTPRRVHLYIDEYQRFASSTTNQFLEEGRKFEVGLTLAHQTLYQIQDQRIRNASRHAGTLIALAVTRPDADQLAGEFPIKPREEWLETITEIDGTKPKLVLSPTPAEDVYIDGHSDPDVDLAARSFFCSPIPIYPVVFDQKVKPRDRWGDPIHRSQSSPGPLPDNRKSAGVHPRPGGVPAPYQVSMEPSRLNGLLYEAMERPALGEPRGFLDELLKPHRCHLLYMKSEQLENESLMRVGIRPWLTTHLEDNEDALRRGEYIFAFQRADGLLAEQHKNALRHGEYMSLLQLPYAPLAASARHFACSKLFVWEESLGLFSSREESVELDMVRQRLRWLWILCEGLAKKPVLIQSGEQEPRERTSHIMHPGQTEQDALNEFARNLVSPAKKYVAHVRLPGRYHVTRLNAPIDGIADFGELGEVKERSRQLYRQPEEPDDEAPPAPPRHEDRPRRIGRWSPPPPPPHDEDPSREEQSNDDPS